MMGSSSLLAAVLTVLSVASLSLLSLLCLRCKRKSKIIHEEHQIYNPQTFQRAGSVFAVTQSKTVTRTNQITSTTVETESEDFSAADEQSDYQNISTAPTGSPEHTYVAPLQISVYENEETKRRTPDADQTPGVYANLSSPPVNDDEDDYENSQFLDQVMHEPDEDEPDYVNENGVCT
ncbi:LAT2 domain-containing protein [Chelmon rostratus]|uniref:LAT2 domain-containing protein n=1 Tax=Chelmon rostratus TaxID=109905 RepID=UPI001BE711A0|nr:LAT2 domain-containing protein [Chelmon rostratus]XP_041808569.1 LAT2 domain-containing protein [Chelmon rostratus]